VKKGAAVAAVVALVLAVLAVVADRVAVGVGERAVSERVRAELPGATDVTTSIQGFPALTQVVGGSLDHVTVTARDVATEKGTLDSVVVDLYDVSTSSPRTARTVSATALVPLSALQAQIGDSWQISVEGGSLRADSTGALPISATVTPVVEGGVITLDLQTLSLAGVEVSGDRVPDFVKEALNRMVGSVGDLPFGLTPSGVTVTPDGVTVTAAGANVSLE
jgi:hypothetical protein